MREEREDEAEVVFLRSSIRTRVLCALTMVLPAALLGVGAFAPLSDRGGFLILGAICFPIFAFLAWTNGMARWRADAEGVERMTPLMQRVGARWSDMIAIQQLSLARLTLRRGPHQMVIQVPGGLVGMEGLLRLALAHAPAGSMSDFTRRLLAQRAGALVGSTMVPVDAPEPAAHAQGDARRRWRENPFFVLGLSPECSRAEVERGGQKLLALLAIGSGAAKRFTTPAGESERTEDIVRAAMAELRDPARRLGHEAWARIAAAPSEASVAPPDAGPDDAAQPWLEAMASIGWRAP